MERNTDYSNFNGFYGYPPYDNFDPNITDNAFNPVFQYEQGYMYYRYLTQALEYKIKCREFEKIGRAHV